MKPNHRSIRALFIALTLSWSCPQATGSSEVLATIGSLQITASDLERALRSSPFITQFNTLEEDQQAAVRGSMLQRLVLSRLLLIEAQAQNLDKSAQYLDELDRFRTGILHRRYMDKIRDEIKIPDETNQQMKAQFKGNHDAYKAAQSAYIADQYKRSRIDEIRRLRNRYHVQVYSERALPGAAPETVLMEGEGIRILYSDLPVQREKQVTKEQIEEQLYVRGELLLTARAAVDMGIDISDALDAFRTEHLPALLVENLEHEWLPDEAPLKAYFDSHPKLGQIVERRHIGQLVLATREEAEEMRRRILAGESLFALAGKYSIDPFGRKNNGDMGWIKEDRGSPVINAAISELKDGEVSEVIETPLGFHLITILERKPGETRPYPLIKDKVRQMYLSEKLTTYAQDLAQKFNVVWQISDQSQKQN
ncbi:MAG: peptidylprolyl isomerase [Gammaproteobacteria bacterium]|nr:peptidylprolyl isomerase [Gammaproteobacteria bacterium]HXK55324.1 peptidylprolyl isomerase [Gammaproteobacteria bacterium]